MRMTDSGIETPSGKGAGDENFPVGSFLLPDKYRLTVNVQILNPDTADLTQPHRRYQGKGQGMCL